MAGTQRPTNMPWSFAPLNQRLTERTRERKPAAIKRTLAFEKMIVVDATLVNIEYS
jgi:hypothetical protein